MKIKVAIILAFFLLFPGLSKAADSGDSLFQSMSIGFFGFNDNNPIDGAISGFEDRRRDDHGLTMLIGYSLKAKLKLFQNTLTIIQFTDQSALYTKGYGTTTTLQADNPLYDDYKYLLKKHPDWAGLYVNDQVSYEKNTKEILINQIYKNLQLGLGIRYSTINSGVDQNMADFQRFFHKITKSRNYYHVPFIDSSIFRGKKITYFSIAPSIFYERILMLKNQWQINSGIGGKLWYNTTSEYGIPEFSPELNVNASVGYGKSFGPNQRKWMLRYAMTYEPKEIVQRYSDPGTEGFQYLGLEFNFRSKKAAEKPFYLHYTLRPYAIYLPIGLANDETIGYVPPSNDLRFIEGILNFSIALRFN